MCIDIDIVFLDFKKAYDSVSQPLAWAVLKRMGIPGDFMTLLKTWTAQSRIALRMGGATLEPFPQETGVPQGGVLSPIIFNLFIEMLLRHELVFPTYPMLCSCWHWPTRTTSS